MIPLRSFLKLADGLASLVLASATASHTTYTLASHPSDSSSVAQPEEEAGDQMGTDELGR